MFQMHVFHQPVIALRSARSPRVNRFDTSDRLFLDSLHGGLHGGLHGELQVLLACNCLNVAGLCPR